MYFGGQGVYVSFVGKTGPITLPSWLSFACASTTSVQTSASALTLGIAANHPVCKWTANGGGLQLDAQDTNTCLNSSAFGSWTVTGSPTNNGLVTDPSGTSTGADLSTGTGAYYSSTSTVGAVSGTVSCWVADAAAPNLANVCVTDGTTAVQIKQAPITGWQHLSASGSCAGNLTSTQIRDFAGGASARAKYAFVQTSALPFATAYIPTTTSAVTRLPSTFTATLPNDSDLIFDLEFELSHAWTVGYSASTNTAHVLTGTALKNFGVDTATGKFRIYDGAATLGDVALAGVAGDVVKFIIASNWSAKTITCTYFVNGVQTYQQTITLTNGFSFDTLSIPVWSIADGTYHVSPAAVRHVGIKPRPMAATQIGDLGTLLAAWDARQGIAKTGALVDSWTPYLGDSSIILSGAGSARPTWVADRGDGRPELVFDGVANWLLSSAANLASIAQTGCGIVVVGTRPTNTAGHVIALNGSASLDRMYNVYYSTANTCVNQQYTPAGDSGAYNFQQDAARQAVVFNRIGASSKRFSRVEGAVTSVTLSVSTLTTALTKFAVGAYVDGTQPGAIKISAIWLFSSPIVTGAEIKAALLATSNAYYPVL